MDMTELLESRPDDSDGNRLLLLMRNEDWVQAEFELRRVKRRKATGNNPAQQSKVWGEWCQKVETIVTSNRKPQ